jgi:hypothetical protein
MTARKAGTLIPVGDGSPIPVDIPDDSSLGMGGNGMDKGVSALTPLVGNLRKDSRFFPFAYGGPLFWLHCH